jgi:hypothetical protein
VPASVAARRVRGCQRASAGLLSQFRWSTLLLGFTLRLRVDDPAGYQAGLAEARERMRELRANGYRPRELERDRRRHWLALCPGPGLTLAELAESTVWPIDVLAPVLRDEARRSPRRRLIWYDGRRYRVAAARLPGDLVEALAALAERD